MAATEVVLDCTFAEAEAAARDALAAEGFGVLTEIDVAATLKNKIGVDRPAMKILGACNPQLAHQALEIDRGAALVLPCNVVIEDRGEEGTSVAIADPFALMPSAALSALAGEAAGKIAGVARRLAS